MVGALATARRADPVALLFYQHSNIKRQVGAPDNQRAPMRSWAFCVCILPACLQNNTDLLDKPSMWVIGGDGWAYDVSVTACREGFYVFFHASFFMPASMLALLPT